MVYARHVVRIWIAPIYEAVLIDSDFPNDPGNKPIWREWRSVQHVTNFIFPVVIFGVKNEAAVLNAICCKETSLLEKPVIQCCTRACHCGECFTNQKWKKRYILQICFLGEQLCAFEVTQERNSFNYNHVLARFFLIWKFLLNFL